MDTSEQVREELVQISEYQASRVKDLGARTRSIQGLHLNLGELTERLGKVAEAINDLGIEGVPTVYSLSSLRVELRLLGALVLQILLETQSEE